MANVTGQASFSKLFDRVVDPSPPSEAAAVKSASVAEARAHIHKMYVFLPYYAGSMLTSEAVHLDPTLMQNRAKRENNHRRGRSLTRSSSLSSSSDSSPSDSENSDDSRRPSKRSRRPSRSREHKRHRSSKGKDKGKGRDRERSASPERSKKRKEKRDKDKVERRSALTGKKVHALCHNNKLGIFINTV